MPAPMPRPTRAPGSAPSSAPSLAPRCSTPRGRPTAGPARRPRRPRSAEDPMRSSRSSSARLGQCPGGAGLPGAVGRHGRSVIPEMGGVEQLAQDQCRGAAGPRLVAPRLDEQLEIVDAAMPLDALADGVEVDVAEADALARDDDPLGVDQGDRVADGVADEQPGMAKDRGDALVAIAEGRELLRSDETAG